MSKIWTPNGATVVDPNAADAGPQIRLLVCAACKTIEELPDYQGHPSKDETLAYTLRNHQSPGHGNSGALLKVDERVWNAPRAREQITKQIRDQMEKGNTGFSPEVYATMDTLRDDAMTCWTKKHNRDPACPDYKTPKMRLSMGAEHAKERKDLGLDPRYDADNPNKTQYLCSWCPVNSNVQSAARKRAGIDK